MSYFVLLIGNINFVLLIGNINFVLLIGNINFVFIPDTYVPLFRCRLALTLNANMKLSLCTGVLMFMVVANPWGCAEGAKVLLYPYDSGFNSRLLNMGKLGSILQGRGHNVSFLVNSHVVKRLNPENIQPIIYPIPEGLHVGEIPDVTDDLIKYMRSGTGFVRQAQRRGELQLPYCEALLRSARLLQQLKRENFDLLIVDNLLDCGRIILDYFDIPTILYSNFGFPAQSDVIYPAITSFVCGAMSFVCETDQLTFVERASNLVKTGLLNMVFMPSIREKFQSLRLKYGFNTSLSVHDSFRNSVVIVNAHFAMDYPRPLMTNVILISGLFYDPKPLPHDIMELVENSPHDAVVVVSFGTLYPQLGDEITGIMAQVLSRLPVTVLWSYKGKPLKGHGSNINFPQADILAHPKTKLFVTHCGISGTFEAVQNGIPVIAVPIMSDQNYNAAKLVSRAKIGVRVEIKTMTEEEFEESVLEVFSNPVYAENAKRISSIINDHDMNPKDKLSYWVDYVIKHQGAAHLVSTTASNLNHFQFYSVDVVLFLIVSCLSFLAACAFLLYLSIRFVLRHSTKGN